MNLTQIILYSQFLRSADAFVSSPTDNENCLLEHREQREARDREDTVNITDNLLSEVSPRGMMDQDGLTPSNMRSAFKESRNSMGVTFKGEFVRRSLQNDCEWMNYIPVY